MDMRKCDVCGEMYSTTYRTCPFCEEEESIRRGKPIHRHAKDFRNKRGSHAAGVLLLVAVLILAGWGIFSLWGDNIAAALGMREANLPEDENGGASVTDPDNTGSSTDDPQMPTIDDPNNESETPSQEEPPETPVTLSSNDFTLFSAGERAQLTASGGSGSYTYSIDNTQVATVAADGWVTAVGNGTATVTVSDGYTTATCTVRVRGVSSSGGEGGTTTSGGTLTLSREDFTLNSTYPTYTIIASGASGTVSWSSSDTSVATVDANGTVTRVGSGTCTITATSGSQTATCIVRVS